METPKRLGYVPAKPRVRGCGKDGLKMTVARLLIREQTVKRSESVLCSFEMSMPKRPLERTRVVKRARRQRKARHTERLWEGRSVRTKYHGRREQGEGQPSSDGMPHPDTWPPNQPPPFYLGMGDGRRPMHHLSAGLMAAALALAALPAAAGTVVIANGLAPPNPANVINAANSYPSDRVVVNNVGCGDVLLCENPGAPTTVEVVEGGFLGASLSVYESSSVLVSGGSIPRSPNGLPVGPVQTLSASGYSTMRITGGNVGALVVYGYATATVTGGSISTADVTSSMDFLGGTLGGALIYSGGIVRIFGSGFAVDGTSVGLGAVEAAKGRLTGTLQSGEALNLLFNRTGFGEYPPSGNLILVPEPATASLMGLGLAGLAAARRRGRSNLHRSCRSSGALRRRIRNG